MTYPQHPYRQTDRHTHRICPCMVFQPDHQSHSHCVSVPVSENVTACDLDPNILTDRHTHTKSVHAWYLCLISGHILIAFLFRVSENLTDCDLDPNILSHTHTPPPTEANFVCSIAPKLDHPKYSFSNLVKQYPIENNF